MMERSMETRNTTSETKTVADNNDKRESGAVREARVNEDWGLGFEGGARSQGQRCMWERLLWVYIPYKPCPLRIP